MEHTATHVKAVVVAAGAVAVVASFAPATHMFSHNNQSPQASCLVVTLHADHVVPLTCCP